MTDLQGRLQETLAKYRVPMGRDQMKQARAYAAPAMRFASKNPMLLIGAGVLALAGIVAFTNRKKIAEKTAPMIEDAKVKGQALMGDATAKGQELFETAKTQGKAIAQKVTNRRSTTPPNGVLPTDVH